MPRRLSRPEPELADDVVRLEPLSRSLAPEFGWTVAGDPDIAEYTRIPTVPADDFLESWLGRYEQGWEDGSRAGFAVRDADGSTIGFAAFVALSLEEREGEIGYALAPAARGRGAARRSVDLLTRWGFEMLGLQRIELWIDTRNEPSVRVAERCGYRLDGVLRSVHFKEGIRHDFAIWSRLAAD